MKIIVESAVPLDKQQLTLIEAILEKKVKETFTVEAIVNEEILGGLRITIGSTRIDASLKGKLDQVKKQLE